MPKKKVDVSPWEYFVFDPRFNKLKSVFAVSDKEALDMAKEQHRHAMIELHPKHRKMLWVRPPDESRA